MLTLSLTRHLHARKELLLGKKLRVVSRSGLNPTEAALVERLPALKAPPGGFRSPLFLGGRTGALAMALWLTRGQDLAGEMALHTFDAHALATMRRNLAENRVPETLARAVSVRDCTALARASGLVFWQMTLRDSTAERDLETLEQILAPLDAGPRHIVIAADAPNETFLRRFRKQCAHVSVVREGALTLISGQVEQPIPPEEQTQHAANFPVSLPGHAPIELTTFPGCFCHRRADMGGLALTETVAAQIVFDAGDRVLDLGCGCGMDGILLATAFPEKRLRIDYQDSNVCAVAAAEANIARHPHDARVVHSAEGEGEAASYDLVLANPPYFGDWRIAEFFIETAARLLKAKGVLAFVSKREAKPVELMQAHGLEVLNTFSRRGYSIVLAARR